MSGELWQGVAQAGVEVTAGTAVAATRRMYFRDLSPSGTGAEHRFHKFSTGSRDNQRAVTQGVKKPGGQVIQALSYSEIIELLLITLKGGVTPSTVDTSAKLWVFTPGTTLDSMTLEVNDGANPWREKGVRGNTLRIAGNAGSGGTGGTNDVTVDLFGSDFEANALTGSLAQRVPDFVEGWEAKLYLDAFGGTPGTTNIAGTLINWDVAFQGNLGRKYTADNTRAMNKVVIGEIGLEAKLTFEAAASQALTEFTNSEAATKRLIRLEFGNNTVVGATTAKGFVTVDIPGAWKVADLGQADEGTRVYQFTYDYLYDATNAWGFQVRAQNARASAW